MKEREPKEKIDWGERLIAGAVFVAGISLLDTNPLAGLVTAAAGYLLFRDSRRQLTA